MFGRHSNGQQTDIISKTFKTSPRDGGTKAVLAKNESRSHKNFEYTLY